MLCLVIMTFIQLQGLDVGTGVDFNYCQHHHRLQVEGNIMEEDEVMRT
jgi:hypothetical protein